MSDRVSIDRKLLICLFNGVSTVLQNPGDKKREVYLRGILDKIDKDAKPFVA